MRYPRPPNGSLSEGAKDLANIIARNTHIRGTKPGQIEVDLKIGTLKASAMSLINAERRADAYWPPPTGEVPCRIDERKEEEEEFRASQHLEEEKPEKKQKR